MSKWPLVFVCLTAAGCSVQSAMPCKDTTTAPVAYAPATASALAFDPPAVIGQPMPSLARAGRAAEAFAGYEDQVTTFSYTHQRDEIRVYNDYGTLERRAYTDRTSITTR